MAGESDFIHLPKVNRGLVWAVSLALSIAGGCVAGAGTFYSFRDAERARHETYVEKRLEERLLTADYVRRVELSPVESRLARIEQKLDDLKDRLRERQQQR